MSIKKNHTLLRALCMALLLSACNHASLQKIPSSEVLSNGHILDKKSLSLLSIGSSKEQVLLTLGTPSNILKFDSHNEAFYYISQTRKRVAIFMSPTITDQKILALYFDKNNRIQKIVHYGLKNGKVFNFTRHTTPVEKKEVSFFKHLLRNSPFRDKPKPIHMPSLLEEEK